ncbi:MAG: porin family protein [Lutibacter sp.]|nr:porin family protein [Lutibacter sp.]
MLLTLATESFAQQFGIKAGLNLSNMLMKDDDDTYSDDFKMNPGFHIGPTMELPINETVSFETGLLLSTKGYKETFDGDTDKYNLLYLDIPLTAKATIDIGGSKIYGIFGPYIGIGLSGKAKYEEDGESFEEDIKFGSDEDEDDLKRLDYGLTIGAGMEFNAIQIGLSYGLGLANISTYTDGGAKISNRVLGISLGYKFGKK